ncbi:MAG: toxin-antitoxin system YwqK family antitoxin, partial [Verrucomicrobiota bacterium]
MGFLLSSLPSPAATLYLSDGQVIENAANVRQISDVFLYEVRGQQRTIEAQRLSRIVGENGAVIFEHEVLTVRKERDVEGRERYVFFVNGQQVAVGKWSADGIFEIAGRLRANGIYRQYYDNGKLEREWSLANGQLNGLCKLYYDSGMLERAGQFVDGREEGISRLYYRSGGIKGESTFVGGIKHGVTRLFYESGQLK